MKSNPPPKEIASAIHGECFDYKDFDIFIDDLSIEDRIYNTWQRLHAVIKDWITEDEKDFINYIKNRTPDKINQ